MSTLSKVFVILVFAVALVKLGVDATLFAQRVDWKDKFVKEVNYHYSTQAVKNAEIQDLILQKDNLDAFAKILNDKINMLETENAAKNLSIANMRREFDEKNATIAKLTADIDVFVRQLEVQLTQVSEMTAKVDDYRAKVTKAANDRTMAVQELQYARQEAEVLSKDLGALQERHIGLAREKQRLDETMAALSLKGIQTDLITPLKQLDGKVTAVQSDLVVISIGADEGVQTGSEFTIYRQAQFIAKITITHADRKWAAGRVTLRKDDPRVSDDVTTNTLLSSWKSR
jgi:DNA repair exonuclease SbcCD ATPase subunit